MSAGTGERIAYVHAGTGKTGSSAIQHALTCAAETLAAHGYLYPDLSDNFSTVLKGKPTAGNAGQVVRALKRDRTAEGLRMVEEHARPDMHLVLSCEGFWNQRRENLVEFVAGLRAAGYRPRCLVVFRPQADMMVSWYLQKVKANKLDGRGLEAYVAEQFGTDNAERRWHWLERAEKLEEAFGRENLTVKWYPALTRAGAPGVVRAAFDWLGVAPPADLKPALINPTPTREALLILRVLNEKGLGGRRFADRFLSEAHREGMAGTRISLGAELRERVERETRADNARLLERYCPELSVESELAPHAPPAPAPLDQRALATLADLAGTILARDAFAFLAREAFAETDRGQLDRREITRQINEALRELA